MLDFVPAYMLYLEPVSAAHCSGVTGCGPDQKVMQLGPSEAMGGERIRAASPTTRGREASM